MSAQSVGSWIAVVTAVVALLGAVVGVLRYFNYRTKRDRIAAVGALFETVVDALASDSEIKRLAAAIRLRRFFDPDSEVGGDDTPYSPDALGVIAGILREQPTGNFQKLLADGLTYAPAPMLVHADLQRTNLQGAYLGGVDVSKADFYRADLSRASLKGAVARDATFYQAKLAGTVFTKADLRDANFYEADLTGVKFGEAQLAGAKFEGAHSIPRAVAPHLDMDGKFTGPDDERMPPDEPALNGGPQIFVSRPSVMTPYQRTVWRFLETKLESVGAIVLTFERSDYPPAGVLSDLRRIMADCHGVIVLGFRQLEISAGCWRPGTSEERSADGAAEATPWNQVEAGIASALGLPLFVVRDSDVTGGVFDLKGDVTVVVADLSDTVERQRTRTSLEQWLIELSQ